MFNLEFTLEELSELHITMCLRKENLKHDREHPNAAIGEIAVRQLERVSPLCYYLECALREHHAAAV